MTDDERALEIARFLSSSYHEADITVGKKKILDFVHAARVAGAREALAWAVERMDRDLPRALRNMLMIGEDVRGVLDPPSLADLMGIAASAPVAADVQEAADSEAAEARAAWEMIHGKR